MTERIALSGGLALLRNRRYRTEGLTTKGHGSVAIGSVAIYDVLVIGGGVNGCGVARDAAGRGYRVLLAEMNDLASGTSSAATKLIHGGLRYLEHYEFRLVREALKEREILWANAPHIIWPLRFVLPYHKGLRPAWMLRLGLFIYDHLGGRKKLPPTRVLDLATDPAGEPLKPGYHLAFEYSDCWVNDARLVVLNARDAANRGADIRVRTKVEHLERVDDHWLVSLRDQATDSVETVTARVVVNAAGPWVDRVLGTVSNEATDHHVRLVQGSHIVVPRLYEHERCYFFQNADERIFFAIPYEHDFTLIGTTDRDYAGDPAKVGISDEEIDYLCRAASEYFRKPVVKDEIVWTFSGVRPLYDDNASSAQEATRDYVLKVDGAADAAKLVNVFGGKLTTYRRLSESVLERIGAAIGKRGKPWTAHASLPGGDFPADGKPTLVRLLSGRFPRLAPSLIARLAEAYGTATSVVLGKAATEADLGRLFGADLHEAEVRYLIEREWARSADDILWRRSKLGLRFTKEQAAALDLYMREQFAMTAPQPEPVP